MKPTPLPPVITPHFRPPSIGEATWKLLQTKTALGTIGKNRVAELPDFPFEVAGHNASEPSPSPHPLATALLALASMLSVGVSTAQSQVSPPYTVLTAQQHHGLSSDRGVSLPTSAADTQHQDNKDYHQNTQKLSKTYTFDKNDLVAAISTIAEHHQGNLVINYYELVENQIIVQMSAPEKASLSDKCLDECIKYLPGGVFIPLITYGGKKLLAWYKGKDSEHWHNIEIHGPEEIDAIMKGRGSCSALILLLDKNAEAGQLDMDKSTA
jgi:hypothetical protein